MLSIFSGRHCMCTEETLILKRNVKDMKIMSILKEVVKIKDG